MKIIYLILDKIFWFYDSQGNRANAQWWIKWNIALWHWRKWLRYEGMPDRIKMNMVEEMLDWNRDCLEKLDGRSWIIWSFEHNAWWAAGHRGYVVDIKDAGAYSFIEARNIVLNANKYSEQPNEAMIPRV